MTHLLLKQLQRKLGDMPSLIRIIRDWKPALNRFAIQFDGRLPKNLA